MPRKSRSAVLSILEGRVTITQAEVNRVEGELKAACARWTEAIAARDAVAALQKARVVPVKGGRRRGRAATPAASNGPGPGMGLPIADNNPTSGDIL